MTPVIQYMYILTTDRRPTSHMSHLGKFGMALSLQWVIRAVTACETPSNRNAEYRVWTELGKAEQLKRKVMAIDCICNESSEPLHVWF